jgi:hypothetical protein
VELNLNTRVTTVRLLKEGVRLGRLHYPSCWPGHSFVLAETAVEDLLATVVDVTDEYLARF